MARDYDSRSHAHVGFLLILALVSLVVALGLSAHRKVQKDTVPAAQEHNRRLEQASKQPRQRASAVARCGGVKRGCQPAAVGWRVWVLSPSRGVAGALRCEP